MISCEEPNTTALLHNVTAIPGAIGYAKASDVAQHGNPNIQAVEINGWADIGAVETARARTTSGRWNTCTAAGRTPGGSLASAFTDYMTSYAAKEIVAARVTSRAMTAGQADGFCHQEE